MSELEIGSKRVINGIEYKLRSGRGCAGCDFFMPEKLTPNSQCKAITCDPYASNTLGAFHWKKVAKARANKIEE